MFFRKIVFTVILALVAAAGWGPQAAAQDEQEESSEVMEELHELREKVERMEQESDARRRLEATEEEEREEEEDILETAGREYYLLRAGMLELEYKFTYSYYSYDSLTESEENDGTRVEHRSNHNLYNHLVTEYGILDNLTFDADVPFVYKYDKIGQNDSMDIHGLGDISAGFKYQPFRTGGSWPSPIFNLRGTFPSSKGDYEINPETELSTGTGLYAVSAGISAYHPFDPVSAFFSLDYNHRLKDDDLSQRRSGKTLVEVDPGDEISASLGFGYSLSYRVSLSMSFSYTYGMSTDYYWRDGSESSSGDTVNASLDLSTNWKLNPRHSVIVGAGVGLTDDDPDFNFSLRIPLQFDLQ